jgi:hypothetical protein
MEAPRSTGPLSRIVPQDADDLDELTSAYDARHGAAGRDIFPEITPALHTEGAFKRPDTVCVGLRVPERLADAHDTAMRLASLAAEQDVEIVVLALTDVSGLERFGFRIERIAGAGPDARERCEQQVRRFWGIDLVL